MEKTAEKVDYGLLRRIDSIQLSDRLVAFRKRLFESERHVAGERAHLAMKGWQETEGQPLQLRQARKLKGIAQGIPVVIHPGELLAGSQTKYFWGGNPGCDYDGSLLVKLMAEGRITLGGPETVGVHTREEWNTLSEAAEYFRGKTTADVVRETTRAVMGNWYDELSEAGGAERTDAFPQAIGVPDFEKVLHVGLRGIIAECRALIREFTEDRGEDTEALEFWQAAIAGCEAAILLARRYSEQARKMAAEEADPARRAELLEIAEVCERVPENPATTFHEALQSMVMIDVALALESASSGVTGWGTVDQYWHPFFKTDLDTGRLTMEKAAELVGCALTYVARRERVSEISWRDHLQIGYLSNLCLGGPTRDGEGDASNEVSYLVLHMAGLLGYAEPHIPIRWHEGTPRWLMRKAMEVNCKVRGGVPQFQNSDHLVALLTEHGVSPETARAWVGSGCSQANASDQRTEMLAPFLNIALPVDLALHNGIASATGKRVGLETGNPRLFETFGQLYEAFKMQCEFMIKRCLWHTNLACRVKARHWVTPLGSALLPGCVEKGRDYARGGLPHYRILTARDRAIVPAADSLMAVKKLVFDENRLTMDELVHSLDTDFQGSHGEEIRQMCLAAPKYGNDVDEVDLLVRDIGKFTAGIIRTTINAYGYPYAINRNGQAWHFANGKKLGALPNGRKARQPLYDGSLSPMQGLDSRGPTALLSSALKADFKESCAGILNMKFPGSLFQDAGSREKLIDLLESFLGAGGTYLQFNILDKDMLLEAKRHPEKYKDLVVRVGGYSAYFVHLSPEVQDDIIRRTEQVF